MFAFAFALVLALILGMSPSCAVVNGVSRRHCRNPALGLGPAGWEGSLGSDHLAGRGTPTAMLRSNRKSSLFCGKGLALRSSAPARAVGPRIGQADRQAERPLVLTAAALSRRS